MGKKHKRPRTAAELARKRPPGLDGTYTGTCVACLRGTDTALAFRGPAEWAAAGLVRLGLPMAEAIATIEAFPGMVEADGATRMFRVCERCAHKAGMTVAVLHEGAAIPVYAPREDVPG